MKTNNKKTSKNKYSKGIQKCTYCKQEFDSEYALLSHAIQNNCKGYSEKDNN